MNAGVVALLMTAVVSIAVACHTNPIQDAVATRAAGFLRRMTVAARAVREGLALLLGRQQKL